MSKTPRITLGEIFAEQGEAMQMRLITGEQGLHRYIDHPRMQKPSLAFAGFLENLNDYRFAGDWGKQSCTTLRPSPLLYKKKQSMLCLI